MIRGHPRQVDAKAGTSMTSWRLARHGNIPSFVHSHESLPGCELRSRTVRHVDRSLSSDDGRHLTCPAFPFYKDFIAIRIRLEIRAGMSFKKPVSKTPQNTTRCWAHA
jgi:hypothetical protein